METNTLGLGIGRVPDKVVPNYRATGFEDAKHFRSHFSFHILIQNGGKGGELNEQIEGIGRKRELLRIPANERSNSKALACQDQSIMQQVKAEKSVWMRAKLLEFTEHATRTTTYFKNGEIG